jgi:hypothetical protein
MALNDLSDLSDKDFTELYGAWAPHTPQDAAELLDGYGGSWWVVGGWAAQAFTGVTRPHEDVDIAIRRGDLGKFREHLAGRIHVWRNDGGTLSPVIANDPDETYPQSSCSCGYQQQRTWLRDTLAQVHPGHAWLERL